MFGLVRLGGVRFGYIRLEEWKLEKFSVSHTTDTPDVSRSVAAFACDYE